MARRKEAPYYLRSKAGRAYIEFTVEGQGQRKATLGLSYDLVRSSAEERRTVEQAAEKKWRELTDGRVVTAHERIKTTSNLGELYAQYLEQWEPPAGCTENERQRRLAVLSTRRAFGYNLTRWANDDSRRPDGTLYWRDKRTPLERLVDDNGPNKFLEAALLRVLRKSMKKEKSNLAMFLNWAKSAGYLASAPPVTLPVGQGTRAVKTSSSGRGVHIAMTPLVAAKIVAVMPEWSHRTARQDGASKANGAKRFRVRDFFEFMRLTGLRPATISRLEVGRNWSKGKKHLVLENADDKAKYGREFPLPPSATKLLQKIAPDAGHIFGHHDFRKHVKAAAAKVLPAREAALFGSYHFRHFVGTLLANRAGSDGLPAAQYAMGHKDLTTTSTYVHADAGGAKSLLGRVDKEQSKAARDAAAWAKKRTIELLATEGQQ